MGRSRFPLSSLAVRRFEGAQWYILWDISQNFVACFDVYINDCCSVWLTKHIGVNRN